MIGESFQESQICVFLSQQQQKAIGACFALKSLVLVKTMRDSGPSFLTGERWDRRQSVYAEADTFLQAFMRTILFAC